MTDVLRARFNDRIHPLNYCVVSSLTFMGLDSSTVPTLLFFQFIAPFCPINCIGNGNTTTSRLKFLFYLCLMANNKLIKTLHNLTTEPL